MPKSTIPTVRASRKSIEAHPAVYDLHKENDGFFEDDRGRPVLAYWCYLLPGWIIPSTGCGTIHERTLRDVADELNDAVYIGTDDA